MHIQKSHIIITAILLLFTSMCIEPFDPPRGDFEDLLVIEGLITDEVDPQIIRISRSFPIDTVQFLPENGAEVMVMDDLGNEHQLQSVGSGEYQTPSGFQGVKDRTYQLFVTTSKGEIIQSDPVTLKSTPKIDSISWEINSRLNDEGILIDGVQIYINTHDPNNDTWNYRWQWEETWEFNARYHSSFQWAPNGDVEVRTENIYTCWSTVKSQNIFVGSSGKLTTDVISAHPIHYVSASGSNRLIKKYSILVKQYALSEAAWFFWQQMEKMNQDLGSLFAPQPTAVKGNLINISEPEKPVIGYFDASTVDEMRLFISKEELGDMRVYTGYHNCTYDTLLFAAIPGYDYKHHSNPLDLIYGIIFPIGYSVSSSECSDCRLYGVNIKPDFWE